MAPSRNGTRCQLIPELPGNHKLSSYIAFLSLLNIACKTWDPGKKETETLLWMQHTHPRSSRGGGECFKLFWTVLSLKVGKQSWPLRVFGFSCPKVCPTQTQKGRDIEGTACCFFLVPAGTPLPPCYALFLVIFFFKRIWKNTRKWFYATKDLLELRAGS